MNSAATQDRTQPQDDKREFLLFVADGEPNSLQAQHNIERILAEAECSYEMNVIDVFKEFDLAAAHNVLVIPCLIMLSQPTAMVIGTMQHKDKVCRALRLE